MAARFENKLARVFIQKVQRGWYSRYFPLKDEQKNIFRRLIEIKKYSRIMKRAWVTISSQATKYNIIHN